MAKQKTIATEPAKASKPKEVTAPPGTKKSDQAKEVLYNKKLRHDYEVLESWEAGLVLMGSEVKSLRNGDVQWGDAHARFSRSELWVYGLHIGAYRQAGVWGHEALQPRKLLLHRRELLKIATKLEGKGLTIVPERLLFRRAVAKLTICLCRGKTKGDKRSDLIKREQRRDVEREMGRRLKRGG